LRKGGGRELQEREVGEVAVVGTDQVVMTGSRVVARVNSVEESRRSASTFQIDTILKVERARSIVPVVRTGKVVDPVTVDLTGTMGALVRC
jgi:hypothetical protein